jgi:hypothetical protein
MKRGSTLERAHERTPGPHAGRPILLRRPENRGDVRRASYSGSIFNPGNAAGLFTSLDGLLNAARYNACPRYTCATAKLGSISIVDLVDRAYVGMIESRGRPGFALEPFKSLRVLGKSLGDKLQCDLTAQFCVLGLIDHAHPAATQPLDDVVVGDVLTNHGGSKELKAPPTPAAQTRPA